jgi:hypothetical protein
MDKEYHSLKDIKRTSKGIIGEIIFKQSRNFIHCTKLSRSEMLDKLPFNIPEEIHKFLNTYWNSLDCFEFCLKKEEERLVFKQLILYEVKTHNYMPYLKKQFYRKSTFTENQIKIYNEAKNKGIIVKIAKLLLFDNWRYTITIYDFNHEKYKYILCNGTKSFQKDSFPS